MPSKLKIISYNCRSFSSNIGIISLLLHRCDILLLRETLINKTNEYKLDNLDPAFTCSYVPAVRKSSNFVGRSSGGLAIFWRKISNLKITPMITNERIMGINLNFIGTNYLLLNVYCPCDYRNVARQFGGL